MNRNAGAWSRAEVSQHRPTARMRSMPSQLGDWMDQVYGPLWQGMSDFWADALDPARWPWARAPSRRAGCSCHDEDKACDPCACTPCDADLVVKGYVGELRVFPITVENPRHSERTITAHMSPWTTSDGRKVELPTQVIPPQLTLKPCEEKTIAVAVRLGLSQKGLKEAGSAEELDTQGLHLEDAVSQTQGATEKPEVNTQLSRVLTDISACQVLYADLSLEGCSIRPIRLAVVLLPRRCNAYPARCGCGCC